MSEEIMQNEATQAESMADYEAHFDDANPWNVVKGYMDNKTRLHIKIEGIVNGGAIAMVEGLRGFIPASRMSLSYIENLEDYLLKELDVIVIDADDFNLNLVTFLQHVADRFDAFAADLGDVYQTGQTIFQTDECTVVLNAFYDT